MMENKYTTGCFRVDVFGVSEWGGCLVSAWGAPAISGTLNQTRQDDDEASTFASHSEALGVVAELRGLYPDAVFEVVQIV